MATICVVARHGLILLLRERPINSYEKSAMVAIRERSKGSGLLCLARCSADACHHVHTDLRTLARTHQGRGESYSRCNFHADLIRFGSLFYSILSLNLLRFSLIARLLASSFVASARSRLTFGSRSKVAVKVEVARLHLLLLVVAPASLSPLVAELTPEPLHRALELIRGRALLLVRVSAQVPAETLAQVLDELSHSAVASSVE